MPVFATEEIGTSSNIIGLGYDSIQQVLAVQFNNGTTYNYYNCDEDTYQEFLNSDSHGAFFHANIRNRYEYALID